MGGKMDWDPKKRKPKPAVEVNTTTATYADAT